MEIQSGDVTADEVLGNIDAMSWAVDTLGERPTIDVAGILEVYRRDLIPIDQKQAVVSRNTPRNSANVPDTQTSAA